MLQCKRQYRALTSALISTDYSCFPLYLHKMSEPKHWATTQWRQKLCAWASQCTRQNSWKCFPELSPTKFCRNINWWTVQKRSLDTTIIFISTVTIINARNWTVVNIILWDTYRVFQKSRYSIWKSWKYSCTVYEYLYTRALRGLSTTDGRQLL